MIVPMKTSTEISFFTVMRHPVVRTLLAVGCAVFITILLVQPSGNPAIGPAAPPGAPPPDREALLVLGHFCVFAALTLLWWWAVEHYMTTREAIATALIIALVMGTSTEFLQANIPDRTTSLVDMSANIVASVATIFLIQVGTERLREES